MKPASPRLAAAIVLACMFAMTPAWAQGTVYNVDSSGVAIDGYDTVAYFRPSGALRGKPEYQTTWQGATWLFASAENLGFFLAEPERYAPQYGGWCAYALSEGAYASDTDPLEGYSVVDGRLYLNWSRRVKMQWQPQTATRIPEADTTWPTVAEQLLDGSARISLLPEE